jgi:carbon-monoxide dehydrogenase small subunit
MAGIPIEVTVNGRARALDVVASHTLLDVLRSDLRLTGTKECCLVGECGACTVLMDGQTVDSCLVLAAEADGTSITTVEGLAREGSLHPLQQAFLDTGAVQCGFCIPGQLVSGVAILARTPNPTREAVEDGLAGNLCRCGGYEQIIEAVMAAARPPGARGRHGTPEVTPATGDRASTPDASLAPQ